MKRSLEIDSIPLPKRFQNINTRIYCRKDLIIIVNPKYEPMYREFGGDKWCPLLKRKA